MKISYDNQQLITIGDDSSVLVWKIQDKEGRAGIRKEAEVTYAEEILITKSDLEDKVREHCIELGLMLEIAIKLYNFIDYVGKISNERLFIIVIIINNTEEY